MWVFLELLSPGGGGVLSVPWENKLQFPILPVAFEVLTIATDPGRHLSKRTATEDFWVSVKKSTKNLKCLVQALLLWEVEKADK